MYENTFKSKHATVGALDTYMSEALFDERLYVTITMESLRDVQFFGPVA